MVVAEVSIEPIGTGSPSILDFVTACVELLEKQRDVKYEVTAMGTIIEGDRKRILTLVDQMHETCLNMGAKRVLTEFRMDERVDKPLHIDDMEREVQEHLTKRR